jgi:hypothetical protein
LQDFAIDAGGDLYLGGHPPDGAAWSVGIRNPRPTGPPEGDSGDELIEVLACRTWPSARPGTTSAGRRTPHRAITSSIRGPARRRTPWQVLRSSPRRRWSLTRWPQLLSCWVQPRVCGSVNVWG